MARAMDPARLGAAADEVLRVPTCFRSFDQRPEDMAALAGALGPLEPPTRVVGLRTSGNYLAPLLAAHLSAAGDRPVPWTTIRPGASLDPSLSRSLAGDQTVVVVDDPPDTGHALRVAIGQLTAATRARVLCALAVLDPPPDLPEGSGVLEWPAWHAVGLLSSPRVETLVSAALKGRTVLTDRGPMPVGPEVVLEVALRSGPVPRRGHAHSVLDVTVTSPGGERGQAQVRAEGVGLGYLGRDSLLAADLLEDWVPPVYGVVEGILVRAQLEESRRLFAPGPGEVAAMAAYLQARVGCLGLVEDRSSRLAGRWPVWEAVGGILEQPFGRWWPLARPLAGALARQLTVTHHPTALDGRTGPGHWFTTGGGGLAKVNFSDSPSKTELDSFDPWFDVAGAAWWPAAVEVPDSLRHRFQESTGEAVDDERWLVYQLVHLLNHRDRVGNDRSAPAADSARLLLDIDASMARAVQSYFSARYFADLQPPDGPLCAIDVDNVLETRWMGVPTISPVGALALRALARHGYRAVLVSGRSAVEVAERCAAYRLVGGVAEYGGVVHVRGGSDTKLLDDTGARRLEEVASRFGPHVLRDPARTSSLRVYSLQGGRLRGVPADALPAKTGLEVLARRYQTDLVTAGLDKGVGLSALRDQIGGRVVLAVGDDDPDLPMLALAERAEAPANASPRVARVARVSRGAEQFGLLDAVSRLIGHSPAACAHCQPPDLGWPGTALGAALFALGGGRKEKTRALLMLARALLRKGSGGG